MNKTARDTVLGEKRHVTSKISDNCRFIGFGLLALYYTIMSSEHGFGLEIRTLHSLVIQGIGVAGALAVVFDYLQYVFGYFSVNQALAREDNNYNANSCAYKARAFLFYAKQIAAGFGALLVVWVIATAALKAL